MSMGGGEAKGVRSAINVTPLIDVLLVLLIIFMVIQPNTLRGLDTLVPQPPKTHSDEVDPKTVVVQVTPDGHGGTAYKVNEDAVTLPAMAGKLTSIFKNRNDRVMFVKGHKDLDFGSVLPVIDDGHAAGVDNIGIITPAVEQDK